MLSFEDALREVTGVAKPVGTERIPIDHATGRVLAEPVRSDRDLPPFDRSERDGFAVRSSDFENGRATLAISRETIYAGASPEVAIDPGTCSRIMTGAPLPEGADAAIPVEKTETNGGTVSIQYDKVAPHIHVHGRGADAKEGEELLAAGSLLTPSRMAVAFSVGAAELPVYERPRVSFLSTGDELVAVDETPAPAEIRDCNGPGLASLLHGLPWLETVLYDRVADDTAALRAAIERALEESDAVVLSGGVSMGDKDLVPGVLQECGVREILHKVSIRPGKPFWLGRAASGALVFGLPGNPVAVQVTFRELVLPSLRKMAGRSDVIQTPYYLPLGKPIDKRLPLRQFVPASVSSTSGETTAAPLDHHGSGDFVSAARADGVIVLPEGELRLSAGDRVRFHSWRATCS